MATGQARRSKDVKSTFCSSRFCSCHAPFSPSSSGSSFSTWFDIAPAAASIAARGRARPGVSRSAGPAATLAIFFGLFIWGGDLYVRLFQPPADALQIYVVGKQWMWKVEHQGGQREINALHVPIRPADPARDDFGRRHSRFFRAGVSHQARRSARPLRNPVVSGRHGRRLTTSSARSSAASAITR